MRLSIFILLVLLAALPKHQEKQDKERLKETISKAVNYLLSKQGEEGGWSLPTGVSISGGTYSLSYLCMRAISAHRDIDPERIDKALAKGIEWLEKPKLKGNEKDSPINSLGYAISIELLLDIKTHKKSSISKEKVDELIKKQLSGLSKSETLGISAIPLGKAIVIMSLARASEEKYEIDRDLLNKTVNELKETEKSKGYFRYIPHGPDTPEENRLKEAIGRGCACALALCMAGEKKKEDIENTVENFFKYRDNLEKARQLNCRHIKETHGAACYYFFSGHYYAALALNYQGEETRSKYKPVLSQALEKIIKKDGTWEDNKFTGPLYGTAMALLIFAELEKGPSELKK